MDTYPTLRRLSSVWLVLSLIAAIVIGLAGGFQVVKGDLSGGVYIILAVAIVLLAQTLSEIVSLFIDIAISLQQIASQNDLPKPIRKLPKA